MLLYDETKKRYAIMCNGLLCCKNGPRGKLNALRIGMLL